MLKWNEEAQGRGLRIVSESTPEATGGVRFHGGAARRGAFGVACLLLIVLFSAASARSAGAASSGTDGDYTRPGATLGFGGVYLVDASAIRVEIENSMGLSARLGYRFTPHLAIEGQFEWIEGFDIVKDPGHRLETWSLTGNLKGLLMTGRIQPFGILGMGVLRSRFVDAGNGLPSPFDTLSNVTRAGFAMRFGGGVEFYVTRNIVVSLDAGYVMPTGSVEDLAYGTFGFGTQWRF